MQKIFTIYDSYLDTTFPFSLKNMINSCIHFYIRRYYDNNFLCFFKHFFKIQRHGRRSDKPGSLIL